MLVSTLLKGFVLGLVVASPVGPIGMLCLRKNIEKDRIHGLMAAAGIALAYGIVVFCILYGLKEFGDILTRLETYFEFIGGGLLIILGAKSFTNRRVSEAPPVPSSDKSYWQDFTATFLFTILNPFSFVTFTIILTALGVLEHKLDPTFDAEFAVSVVIGTLVFWGILNNLLHIYKKSSPELIHKVLNHVTGIALIFFGLLIFMHGFIN